MDKPPTELTEARIKRVEEHVRYDNEHDLVGIMSTFGESACHDEPWGEHHLGRDGVRGYYETLLRMAPDLKIDVRRRHIATRCSWNVRSAVPTKASGIESNVSPRQMLPRRRDRSVAKRA